MMPIEGDEVMEKSHPFVSLKEMDALLRCGICMEFMTTAMMFEKCSHNFCSLCIRHHIRYKQQCPTCGETSVETDLRNNCLIDDIIQLYIVFRPQLEIAVDDYMLKADESRIDVRQVSVPASQLKLLRIGSILPQFNDEEDLNSSAEILQNFPHSDDDRTSNSPDLFDFQILSEEESFSHLNQTNETCNTNVVGNVINNEIESDRLQILNQRKPDLNIGLEIINEQQADINIGLNIAKQRRSDENNGAKILNQSQSDVNDRLDIINEGLSDVNKGSEKINQRRSDVNNISEKINKNRSEVNSISEIINQQQSNERKIKQEPEQYDWNDQQMVLSQNDDNILTNKDIKASIKTEGPLRAPCPVCYADILVSNMNSHLDQCLMADEKKESLRRVTKRNHQALSSSSASNEAHIGLDELLNVEEFKSSSSQLPKSVAISIDKIDPLADPCSSSTSAGKRIRKTVLRRRPLTQPANAMEDDFESILPVVGRNIYTTGRRNLLSLGQFVTSNADDIVNLDDDDLNDFVPTQKFNLSRSQRSRSKYKD